MQSDCVRILNIDLHNITKKWLLEHLMKGVVFTPNIDHLVNLQKDKNFYHAYQSADFVLLDSQVIFMLYNLMRKNIPEKISGVDFFPEFCRHHAGEGKLKFFFLGGLDDSVHRAAQKINDETGRKMVVASYSAKRGFEEDEEECMNIVNLIAASGANVLAIGIGSPRQEKWIHKYRSTLTTIDIFFAVGGTFDVISGKTTRAPLGAQKLGLEWFYRLWKEPRRLFKRYLVTDMQFFYYFLLERLRLYRNPFAE